MKQNKQNISLKKGREWHLRRGHPWLFSGGISQAPGKIQAGSLVSLLDCDGKFVATGYYNPNCDIAVRVLSRDANQAIDKDFLAKRIKSAWNLRCMSLDPKYTNVFRLINAEGDFLPGFIVDYYAGTAVIQCHTAGADALLETFVEALDSIVKPHTIVIRNDASVRYREGLETEPPRIVKGEIKADIVVIENGRSFYIDPISGQKTGFFTDQRDKRDAVAKYAERLVEGSTMLNCFSYTCSFSIYAETINPKMKTINVDQSQPALDQGRRNFSLNGLAANKHEFHCMDAFAFMESDIAHGTTYDIVILDPPAFAKTHKDKEKALKGYARMTTLGLGVVKNGGVMVLCSCSGSISLDEFVDCIKQSAGTSGRSVQILETFQHGNDHPTNIMAPEGGYLKVIFCRVLD